MKAYLKPTEYISVKYNQPKLSVHYIKDFKLKPRFVWFSLILISGKL